MTPTGFLVCWVGSAVVGVVPVLVWAVATWLAERPVEWLLLVSAAGWCGTAATAVADGWPRWLAEVFVVPFLVVLLVWALERRDAREPV